MEKALSVELYLKKHMLHHQEIDTKVHVQNFIRHMEKGLKGEESSLAMLASYVEVRHHIPRNENIIVLDAGGTHVRSALVHFNDRNQPIISHFTDTTMPGTKGQISCEEFFDHFARQIKDITDKSSKIGFCFSFPTEAMPNHDGRLLFLSKGIDVQDYKDILVAEHLKAALERQGCGKDYDVIIVNDTVTTLLSGITSAPERQFNGYIGAILGTGTNIAYAELNSVVSKIFTDKPNVRQIINIESGDFTGFLHGSIEREFNHITAPKDRFAFEKTMSGAYLGPLAGYVLAAMCREKIFSPEFADKLVPCAEQMTTIDLCHFLSNPFSESHSLGRLFSEDLKHNSESIRKDFEAVYYTCEMIVRRAAKFFACALASVILKSGCGLSPLHPVCVVIDGTTFYAVKNFEFFTKYYLEEILSEDNLRYYEIVRVESASLLGAAVAALTTFGNNKS